MSTNKSLALDHIEAARALLASELKDIMARHGQDWIEDKSVFPLSEGMTALREAAKRLEGFWNVVPSGLD
jgi:hypothetical protein